MEQKKKSVALSSILASLALTLSKLIVGTLTGSIGIISEAAHSALDLSASIITYMAVRISGRPADISHHFGHGKAESISALIEAGLLLLTSVWIISEAVQRLLSKSVEIQVTWYAFAIMIVSVVVDFSRSAALNRVAKETHSQALEADALHFKSDIYTSLAVIFGLFLTSLGIKEADPAAAIIVAIFVAFASYRLGRRTIDVLMDKAPDGLANKVLEITENMEGVLNVNRLRMRPGGSSIFIDMAVSISRKAPLAQVNGITKSIEQNIRKIIPNADTVIHVNPVTIEKEGITQRVQIIAVNHNAIAHDIIIHDAKGKRAIQFNLEVDSLLSFDKAHQTATQIENEIRSEIGQDVSINTHIEPLEQKVIKEDKLSAKEVEKISLTIINTAKKIPEISNIHDIDVSLIDKKILISLHCNFKNIVTLEEAHKLTTKIEDKIKHSILKVDRVIVHAEPSPN